MANPEAPKPDVAACLWFNGEAEAAANFYVATFGGRMGAISRYGAGGPFAEGTALVVEFEIRGYPLMALNGGPHYAFTPAVSLSVACDTQDEIDRLWSALTSDGGSEGFCGWRQDRFGFSWQIVPRRLGAWMKGPSAEKVRAAFMSMRKLDIATLAAAAGE